MHEVAEEKKVSELYLFDYSKENFIFKKKRSSFRVSPLQYFYQRQQNSINWTNFEGVILKFNKRNK